MVYYLLFLFLAVGSKLVLAVVMIYLLLPADRSCNNCDAQTLLIRMGRGGRLLSWLCRHRLQRRWCPACGWDGLARATRGAGVAVALPIASRQDAEHVRTDD